MLCRGDCVPLVSLSVDYTAAYHGMIAWPDQPVPRAVHRYLFTVLALELLCTNFSADGCREAVKFSLSSKARLAIGVPDQVRLGVDRASCIAWPVRTPRL
jgi:hypothetical protein